MLLEKLIARQEALRLSDVRFAARLGVSRSTWQATRTGAIPLGRTIAQAARRAFPDLTADAVCWLLADCELLADVAG